MYKCEICNRDIKTINRSGGYIVCSKHMHQYRKYGKFLDNNPRTNNDLNDYIIEGEIAKFNIYNQKNEYVETFIIDKEDIEKIKYNKWRIDSSKHIITGNCSNTNPRRELSRIIINCTDDNLVVDHINCNTLDNRKNNLRICTQAENTYNKSKINNISGFMGISYSKKRKCWCPDIRKNNIRIHLGRYKKLEEAVYVRYIAECILFKEYRNTNLDIEKFKIFETIENNKKEYLKTYVANKINNKF